MGRTTSVAPAAPRGPWLRTRSSLGLLGGSALAAATLGAVVLGSPAPSDAAAGGVSMASASVPAQAGTGPVRAAVLVDRGLPVSRDSQRDALGQASDAEVVPAAAAVAQQRNAALQQFAQEVQREANATPVNSWKLPLQGYRLTARFGQGSSLWVNRHTGLDFAAPTGTVVSSVTSGRVLSAGSAGAYGNRIVVRADDGTETWYCHLSAFAVTPGDTVAAGQSVGKVGTSGNVTGPHLHLEVRPGGGDPVDPYAALVARGVNPG